MSSSEGRAEGHEYERNYWSEKKRKYRAGGRQQITRKESNRKGSLKTGEGVKPGAGLLK